MKFIVVLLPLFLLGCQPKENTRPVVTETEIVIQKVPEALTIIPAQIKTPDPAKMTQRDVAEYIINVHARSKAMEEKLRQISEAGK